MHGGYVLKLQFSPPPLDEHQGYCPNLWATPGGVSVITAIAAAEISRKCFIGDAIIEESCFSNSALANLVPGLVVTALERISF